MISRVHKMVAAAVAAVGLGSSTLLAAPFVTVKIEGRKTDADPWSSSLTQLTSGAAIQYRVVAEMNDVGTQNVQGATTRTINSLFDGKDGIGGLQFNLVGLNGANLTFGSATRTDAWDDVPQGSNGTAGANALTSIKIGPGSGQYIAIDSSVAMTGTASVNSTTNTGALAAQWASNFSGAIKFNSTATTTANQLIVTGGMVNSADPIVVFAPLSLIGDGGGDIPSLISIDGTTPAADGSSARTFALGNLLKGANVTTQYGLKNNGTLAGNVAVTSNSPGLTTNWNNPTSLAGGATAFANFSLNTGSVALGSFSGALTVDNETNPADANDTITVTANVGLAVAADSGQRNRSAFVPANALSAPVATGGSYVGLSSQTTRGGAVLGTKAEILAGSNSGPATVVTMNWRTRAADETPGTATNPPINLAVTKGLIADVVDLNGIATGQVYVMQMSYDDQLFAAGEEARAAAAGQLYLVALNEINGRDTAAGPADDLWVNAVDLNNNGTGSGANKQLTVGAWNNDLTVGHYGVDTTNNVVWAVMNRDLQFSVVPEPATFGLLGLAAAAFGFGRRRRA